MNPLDFSALAHWSGAVCAVFGLLVLSAVSLAGVSSRDDRAAGIKRGRGK